jgi:hypothetical protein
MIIEAQAGVGDLALSNEQENRECNTVDMTWGLCGFQYGLHLLVARKAFTESLVANCVDHQFDFASLSSLIPTESWTQAVDSFELFNEEIFEHFMYSTYGLVSLNEHGVQTAETCLNAYIMLDRELTARKIPRPVVMLTDNHASRKGEPYLRRHQMQGGRRRRRRVGSRGRGRTPFCRGVPTIDI